MVSCSGSVLFFCFFFLSLLTGLLRRQILNHIRKSCSSVIIHTLAAALILILSCSGLVPNNDPTKKPRFQFSNK